jgi:opacity protein-like surface antigen
MKKITTLFTAIVATIVGMSGNVNAQGLYVDVGAGYGFNLACQTLGVNESANSIETVKGSLGRGIIAGAGVGYMFNENIGAEINFNYLLGSKTTIKDETSTTGPADERTIKATMLRINPAVKFTFGERIKPYAKFGVVVGVAGKTTETYTYYFENIKSEETEEHTGGIAIGLSGAAGADIMFGDKFGIYVEVASVGQSWASKKSEITKYDVNGVDQLANLTTSQKEKEFVDSYDPTVTQNPDEPTKLTKIYAPFSSWGFNVGIHLALGGGN